MVDSFENRIEEDTDTEIRQQGDQQLPRDLPDVVPPPADYLIDLQAEVLLNVIQIGYHPGDPRTRNDSCLQFITEPPCRQ